ncbi:MAG: hypothetical protein K1X29_08060 [Bdellovibrionales bacterium]|nr:hypothetical protein [Bdellovibrionales bacterium]
MKSIIALLVLIGTGSMALAQGVAFHDSQRRVLATTDVLRFLFAKLNLDLKYSHSVCGTDSTGVLIVTGAFSPLEKKPVIDKPEGDYFTWYRECVKAVLNQKISDLSIINAAYSRYSGKKSLTLTDATMNRLFVAIDEEVTRAFGKYLISSLPMPTKSSYSTTFEIGSKSFKVTGRNVSGMVLAANWNDVKPEVRAAFVRHLLSDLVGPEIALRELRFIGPKSVYPGRPATVKQLVQQLISMPIKTSGESTISVSSAYKFYAFVILTNPTLLEY